MSPDITPPSKAQCHNTQGPLGSRQVCSSEWDAIEDCSIDMVSCPRVIVMEFCYLRLCMEILIDFLAVIAIIVTLPLDQILKSIVPHSTVKELFNCVLILAIDECWWW
jgi:hypothetical protein